jgi:hypothetical protein
VGGFLQITPSPEVLSRGFTRIEDADFDLDPYKSVTYNAERIMSQSLYRYYYYYGPLSSGRDGSAMGCRRAMQT